MSKAMETIQKMAKNSQKVEKNVKKSQNLLKKASKNVENKKLCFSEEQLCDVAGMFFRCEMQTAALTAILGLYFADEVDKHALLKEFMRIDRFMHKFSSDCHKKIAELTGAEVAELKGKAE